MAKQKKKHGKLTTGVVALLAVAALAGGNNKTSSAPDIRTTTISSTATIEIKTKVPTATPSPTVYVTVKPTAQPTQKTKVSEAVTPKPQMVWVVSTGKKYHSKSTCSNMKSPMQITKTDAIKQGYTPCKKCY